MSEEKLTYRELGVQAAFKSYGRYAIEAHEHAAYCRASGDPEVVAAAEHYDAIGEMWARKANKMLATNPPPEAF